MKKVAAILGFLAIVGGLPVSASAMAGVPAAGQSTSQTQRRAELQRLRQELQKLQRELREHEAALRTARRNGDRIGVARETAAIKRIKDEISRIQRRIRQLERGR